MLSQHNLQPLFRLFESSAWLIAHGGAMAGKDLSSVVTPLASASGRRHASPELVLPPPIASGSKAPGLPARDTLRMAVPDGHQQRHAVAALRDAGRRFDGYEDTTVVRRPTSQIACLEVKVIRPHDMPQLIATGEVDVAITGRDCLSEHLYAFPSSPAVELLDLRLGQYNLSAVVTE